MYLCIMPKFILDEDAPILVEFSSQSGRSGFQDTGVIPSGEQLVVQSTQAVQKAMNLLRGLAKLTVESMNTLPDQEKPSQIEMEFGIKLNAEGNASIVKIGGETTIKVKLTWGK